MNGSVYMGLDEYYAVCDECGKIVPDGQWRNFGLRTLCDECAEDYIDQCAPDFYEKFIALHTEDFEEWWDGGPIDQETKADFCDTYYYDFCAYVREQLE